MVNNKFNYKWVLLAIALAVVLIRIPALNARTIHIDEGMGIRASEFVLSDSWQYSPHNGHGATLFYAGAVIRNFAGTNVAIFRMFTALCMLAVIFLLWVFYRKKLSLAGQIILLGGLGFSSGLLFFSAYFIHEAIFILFTAIAFLCFEKWIKFNKGVWLGFGIVFLALMYMTKETALLTYASWLFAGLIILIAQQKLKSIKEFITRENIIFWGSGIFISGILYVLFFGANLDLLKAPFYWISERGVSMHIRPFHYYLTLLFFHEFFILLPAGLFFVILFIKKLWNPRLIFFFLWFLFLLTAYSLIPYKTPWLIPNIILPLGLFLAFSIDKIWQACCSKLFKDIIIFLAIFLFAVSLWGLYTDNFTHPDRVQEYDYAYLQAGKGLKEFISTINGLAAVYPEKPLPVQIIGKGDELLYVLTEGYDRIYPPFKENMPVYINYLHSAEQTKSLLASTNKEYVFLKFTYINPLPEIDIFVQKDLFETYRQSPYFIAPQSVWPEGIIRYN